MSQHFGRGGARIGALITCVLLLSGVGCAALDEEDPELEEAALLGPDPVIFVPTCPPPGTDYPTITAATYQPFVNFLISKGYPANKLFIWVPNTGLPVCYSTYDLAHGLDAFVTQVMLQTLSLKVDIVGVSGGAVTGLLWMNEFPLAKGKVKDFVAIAGPTHGTEFGALGGDFQDMVGAPSYEQLKELFPPYACQGQTFGGESEDVQFEINGCLTPTGRTVNRDETPGGAKFMSVWNTVDDQIIPPQAACLNQRFQNDCASNVNRAVTAPAGPCNFPPAGNMCPAHLMTFYTPGVFDMVYNHIK